MRREPELYKDKVEVSLDGRQIFYLFFGGSVIVGLVFVLGVMVGKRVEARAHVDQASTATARDPLAALDRLDDGELQFRKSLGGGGGEAPPVDQEIPAIAAKAGTVQPAAPAQVPSAPVAAPAVVVPALTPAPAKPVAVARPAAPRPVVPVVPVAAKPDKNGKYTLQLSAFQQRSEAEMFMDQVKSAGYKAFVAEAAVDGKGTFFRVRFGTYTTYDAAVEAKSSFEAKMKKIAYVTKL